MKRQMIKSLQRLLGVVALMALGQSAAVAGTTYYWTGAADAFWTNAANWRVGSADGAVATTPPGKYYNAAGTEVGANGDTACFGPISSANTTIDLSGIGQINFVNVLAGAPAYVFGTEESSAQALRWDSTADSQFTVESGVTNEIRVRANRPAGSYRYLIYCNNSTDCQLTFGGFYKWGTSDTSCNFRTWGSGPIAYYGACAWGVNIGGVQAFGAGELSWGEKNMYPGYRVNGFKFASQTGTEPFRLVVPDGRFLFAMGGGGPFCSHFAFEKDYNVSGGGWMYVNHYWNDDAHPDRPGVISVSPGKKVTLDIFVKKYYYDATYKFSTGDFFVRGDGTLSLLSSNNVAGITAIFGSTTVEAKKLGNAGSQLGETSLSLSGPVVFANDYTSYAGAPTAPAKGTLAYIGSEAVTCDRTLSVTNLHATQACVALSNRGGGKLTWTGALTQLGATAGATVTFDAATADLEFAGAFESGKNWNVEIKGANCVRVTSDTGAVKGSVTVSGGTLELGTQEDFADASGFVLAGGCLKTDVTRSFANLSVAAASSVEAADDAVLTLPTIDAAALAGRKLDVAGGTVRLPLLPEGETDLVTYQGARATIASDGTVGSLLVRWATAVDGNWNETAKWDSKRLPTAANTVRIDAEGPSYAVSVTDGSSDAVKDITVGNAAADGTATLSFEGARDFTADSTLSVADGGCVAFSGAENEWHFADGAQVSLLSGAALSVDSGVFAWDAPKASLALAGGSVTFGGTSVFTVTNRTTYVRGDTSVAIAFGEGKVSFEDDSRLNASNTATMITVAAGKGKTAELNIRDRFGAFITKDGYQLNVTGTEEGGCGVLNWELEDGRSLNTDTKTLNEMAGFRIGADHGRGVLNIKSGILTFANGNFRVGGVMENMPWNPIDNTHLYEMFAPTGVVNQTGGKLTGGGASAAYTPMVCGFEIGSCPYLAEWHPATYKKFYGEYNLSGGAVDIRLGMFLLGVGHYCRGVFNQTGGTFAYRSSYTHGGDDYRHPMLIGLGAGKGTYRISGGTASTVEKVFVGGARKADLDLTDKAHHSDIDYAYAEHASSVEATEGRLEIAGGSFATESDLIVGASGTGTLDISGGTLTCRDLVLSNHLASTLAYTLAANGPGGWAVTADGRFVITDKAKLVVDATAFAGKVMASRRIELLKAGSVEGSFAPENVEIRYNAADPDARSVFEGTTLSYSRNGRPGLWLVNPKWGKGLMLIFR